MRAYQAWRWAEAALTNLLDDPLVRGVVCNLRTNPARAAQEQAESRIAQLETALESRLTIELAKGYLAGRHDLAPDDAYQLLRGYARSHHLTLRDVCRRVVAGDLALDTVTRRGSPFTVDFKPLKGPRWALWVVVSLPAVWFP